MAISSPHVVQGGQQQDRSRLPEYMALANQGVKMFMDYKMHEQSLQQERDRLGMVFNEFVATNPEAITYLARTSPEQFTQMFSTARPGFEPDQVEKIRKDYLNFANMAPQARAEAQSAMMIELNLETQDHFETEGDPGGSTGYQVRSAEDFDPGSLQVHPGYVPNQPVIGRGATGEVPGAEPEPGSLEPGGTPTGEFAHGQPGGPADGAFAGSDFSSILSISPFGQTLSENASAKPGEEYTGLEAFGRRAFGTPGHTQTTASTGGAPLPAGHQFDQHMSAVQSGNWNVANDPTRGLPRVDHVLGEEGTKVRSRIAEVLGKKSNDLTETDYRDYAALRAMTNDAAARGMSFENFTKLPREELVERYGYMLDERLSKEHIHELNNIDVRDTAGAWDSASTQRARQERSAQILQGIAVGENASRGLLQGGHLPFTPATYQATYSTAQYNRFRGTVMRTVDEISTGKVTLTADTAEAAYRSLEREGKVWTGHMATLSHDERTQYVRDFADSFRTSVNNHPGGLIGWEQDMNNGFHLKTALMGDLSTILEQNTSNMLHAEGLEMQHVQLLMAAAMSNAPDSAHLLQLAEFGARILEDANMSDMTPAERTRFINEDPLGKLGYNSLLSSYQGMGFSINHEAVKTGNMFTNMLPWRQQQVPQAQFGWASGGAGRTGGQDAQVQSYIDGLR